MKFCPDHWQRLRDAVDARGLTSLIAESGEKAAANLANELAEGLTIDNFDPLMGAHDAILSNVMNLVGLEVMYANEDGSDRCPLCFLNKLHQEKCEYPDCEIARVNGYDVWIDKAADDALTQWKALHS